MTLFTPFISCIFHSPQQRPPLDRKAQSFTKLDAHLCLHIIRIQVGSFRLRRDIAIRSSELLFIANAPVEVIMMPTIVPEWLAPLG